MTADGDDKRAAEFRDEIRCHQVWDIRRTSSANRNCLHWSRTFNPGSDPGHGSLVREPRGGRSRM